MSHYFRTITGALAVLLVTGCFEDRARPLPTEQPAETRLSALVVAPRSGLTVAAGAPLTVTVSARDLAVGGLEGVGYVVRQFAPGSPVIDSASFRFTARTDTTHDFSFAVPADLPTNTQLDVYGVAFGPGSQAQLSDPSFLIVVQCTPPACVP